MANKYTMCKIRLAKPYEAEELTRLAFLSKAHWGYPPEWLEFWPSLVETWLGTIGII